MYFAILLGLTVADVHPIQPLLMMALLHRLFLKVYESAGGPPMDRASLDPQLYSLLTQCFTREPENRPSAAQLKKHVFVQQGLQY